MNDSLEERIATAKQVLEDRPEDEAASLEPEAEANFQEALEFLFRLESMVEDDATTDTSPEPSDAEMPECALTATLGPEIESETEFASNDVVCFEPAEEDLGEEWLAMPYPFTVSIETAR